jgi:mevalonate pyrophosphate decarboxylase|tara:strand:- start:1363 stop:1557 length:195 start_codon:yes stop_codon:yes gene_type:complete
MKKRLSSCEDCGEDNFILTQVSSGPNVVFLCSECYDQKYLNETQKEIKNTKKINSKRKNRVSMD